MIRKMESFVNPRVEFDPASRVSRHASLSLLSRISRSPPPPPSLFSLAPFLPLARSLTHLLGGNKRSNWCGQKTREKKSEKGESASRSERMEGAEGKKKKERPLLLPLPLLSASSVPLPPPVEGNRSSAVQERDEDVRASVDSGIEGGTEKERTREKEGGKRSATKVAVTPCKASKLNG